MNRHLPRRLGHDPVGSRVVRPAGRAALLRLGRHGGQACGTLVLKRAIVALLAPLVCGPTIAAPCALIGAHYEAWPPRPGPIYRMVPALLPPDADGAAVLTRWRFSAFDPHSGATLGALNMVSGCSNGRGPCATWPPNRNRPNGGWYSTVL